MKIVHPEDLSPARGELDLTGASEFHIGQILATQGMAAYEPEVFSLLAAYFEAEAPVLFLDIGANVGGFALFAKAVFADRVDVTAFEPLPRLSSFLRQAAKRNDLSIQVMDYALSNRTGQAQFYVSNKSDASNSLNRRFRPHKDVIDVEVRTVDELFPEPVGRRCVMKIDTESTEPDVLEGAADFIRREQPAIVCEVLAGRTEDRLAAWAREVGYRAIQITDSPAWDADTPLHGDTTYTFRDWLFVPAPPSELVRARFVAWMDALRRPT